MSIRDIKARARRDLHNLAKVAASFYATPVATPRLIHVRVHTKFNIQDGDLKGTNLNFAEKEEEKPKLLFFREQVYMPPRNGLVIISPEEGYRIGQADSPDGLSIKAAVIQLKPEEIAAMPNLVLPEGL